MSDVEYINTAGEARELIEESHSDMESESGERRQQPPSFTNQAYEPDYVNTDPDTGASDWTGMSSTSPMEQNVANEVEESEEEKKKRYRTSIPLDDDDEPEVSLEPTGGARDERRDDSGGGGGGAGLAMGAAMAGLMRNGDEVAHTKLVMDDVMIAYRKQNLNTLFFPKTAAKKRIDYVLAYEEDPKKSRKRLQFEKNLRKNGLELHTEDKSESVDLKTYYVLVHAPWSVLASGAEVMNMKKRLKINKTLYDDINQEVCCAHSCQVPEDIVPEEDEFFTSPFNISRRDMFAIDNEETFFTNAERSLIVKEVLDRTMYIAEDEDTKKFGVNSLLRSDVYTAVYPLHEGPYKPDKKDPNWFIGEDKDRMRLYESWARPARCCNYQPLDLVRKYLGEKVAIYFAWLGYYTTMLFPAALVGILAMLYGGITMWWDIPSNDICDVEAGGNYTMCPACNLRCSYWKLEESCIYSRITYLFDNYATVAFSVFMGIWATVFLEMWKRKEMTLGYEWDVQDFEMEERMRPEFEFKVKKKRLNPITNANEPYMSFVQATCRTCTSLSVALFFIVVVLVAIFGVIMYRIIIVAILYAAPIDEISTWAKIITSITGAVINLILIMILSIIYKKVAYFLTELEMNRTETEYENSYTFKLFLFQFVNFYGSIFYIAFFKGRFIDRPGSKRYYLFNEYQQDTCDPSGCMIDLVIQLVIVMIGKQAINNAKEILMPVFFNIFRKKKSMKDQSEESMYMRWEQDKDMQAVDRMALFDEYLEMVIQFGFVTLFVAAFPLAPLFALLNNIIEIRLDAYKFTTQSRRPPALKAQDIGVWYSIMQSLTFIAIVSNACIIAWTSDFIPKLVYIFRDAVNDHGGPTNVTTLAGYLQNSLSSFDVSDFQNGTAPMELKEDEFGVVTECMYPGYRNPHDHEKPYNHTLTHWLIFTARLAFIIIYEHVCFLVAWLITYMIPDVPASTKRLMLYEKQLTKHMVFNRTFPGQHDGDGDGDGDGGGKGREQELGPRLSTSGALGRRREEDEDQFNRDSVLAY